MDSSHPPRLLTVREREEEREREREWGRGRERGRDREKEREGGCERERERECYFSLRHGTHARRENVQSKSELTRSLEV